MHDIKAIRADPAAFDAGLARRGLFAKSAQITDVDATLRWVKTEYEKGLGERNSASKMIGEAKALGDELQAQMAIFKVGELKARLPALEARETELQIALEVELSGLPNLPAQDVPDGLDESANVVVHTRGTPPTFDFTPREHDTLALKFGYDPDTAATIAGARFAVLKGPLARLHRALGQFMIDRHVETGGFTEVAPPLLVLEKAVFGAGQLPKFADDLFKTTDGRYLISTAEVSLTNLVREKIVDAADLPLRFTALTPCFRSEAGSAGRDTRGLIRQHQFDKVELVAIVADAEAAAAEHERMTAHAEGILDALGLPYRRMLLCAGDMGFSARKTYDLEVWLPGQGAYREISSCSDCGDFQARRMDARYKTRGEKGTKFVHTLNGSALAVGRTLVAVIENYQRADGSVAVPEVLAPYMGGVTELVPG
ncbi:serine--tRNA ligase [Polymorphobacter sp. PAMC 29334]|uniref:serine--tRNA ligase n=1 Tax=Polymorphobacter sp. PAMC 29334 TaxID=2862331 RepID=UPI001C76AB31|nr:serine--tRNA ligase [Polymorphobacter sp. PAMC 29334]QYE34797.1 serine--tRNA ligase [Polymorphobacter sp. PAMC 29334]